MKGYLTSYVQMFSEHSGAAPVVAAVTIPMIQRDYAQGRDDERSLEIRLNFLEALLNAVAGGPSVGLDFIYGRMDGTTFHPLDGQQRLTTLFMLHWYIASRCGALDGKPRWTNFSYATRASARRFCEELGTHPLPEDEDPGEWITDQPWFLHGWRNDPTIEGMLVMLSTIAAESERLHPGLDPQVAWTRLTDAEDPAVSFYLLPLDDMESDEDLYIKMNSRGKPLTPFENFKARFEQDIRYSAQSKDFVRLIDGAWSNLFWPYRGDNDIVDEEFMNYLDYVTELCELREGRLGEGNLGPRARAIFGASNDDSEVHLDFLLAAFNTWLQYDKVDTLCAGFFSKALPGDEAYDPSKVVLFTPGGTDLRPVPEQL